MKKTYLAVYYERVVLLNDMMINLHGFRDTVHCVQTNPFGRSSIFVALLQAGECV